jgi:SAM-dependent methyltransferase
VGGLYADPVLYDILYTPGTAAEVDALERIEKHHATLPRPRNRLWFEPACGTGRYLRVARGRGRRVAGFDLDERQLAYARGRLDCPARHLFSADMTNFDAEFAQSGLPASRIGFAFNPVNTLRHLPSDAAYVQHFAQMARVMAPGALYVVGLSLVNYDWLFPEEDVWQATRGSCRVTQLVNYLPPEPGTKRARRETVLSHLTVNRPGGEEHFDASYDLHCCDRKQWRQLLKRAPVQWVASCDPSGQPLNDRTLPYQWEVLRFGGASI